MGGPTTNIEQPQDTRAAFHKGFRGRVLTLKVLLLILFAVVAVRLIEIQVVRSPMYREIARRQYEATVVLPATRGNICDRNGKVLASNTMFVSFGADPRIVGLRAVEVAERFARVFGKNKQLYLAKLAKPDKRFVWLERRVRPEYSVKLNAGEFEGVIQLNEPQRLYHYDHVGGQLIGFTDIDNRGLSGIELKFDEQLRGTNGYVVMQRDGLGRRRPSVDYPRVEPINGSSVTLTIDLEYQLIAEEELRIGVERNKSESGLVVMMDPTTGELLALANYPSIYREDMSVADQVILKNRAITDMFEPGSIFKVVTAAAALERDCVRPDDQFYAEHGEYKVTTGGGGTRIISDIHAYDMLTFRQAVEVSSNIVMAKISDVIGAEALYTTARDFGFGIASGLGLPGEVSGELKKPNQWSGTTLNTMAYGYEVGVTPMQIAAAYSAVANHGVLMKPYVWKHVNDEHGTVTASSYPQVIRRVVSERTARTLRSFLEGVVTRGTGATAKIEGVRVYGKTGTSRKYVGGKYQTGSYTASFVGFFPGDGPQVVCLVMLDNPREGGYTGAVASAPIFQRIAQKVLATSDRFRQKQEIRIAGRRPLAVPDVMNLRTEVAAAMLTSQGFEVETTGKGNAVVRQEPPPGTKLPRGGHVRLATSHGGAAVVKGLTVVPDVRRLTIRRAINRLTMQNLDVVVTGSGIVQSQNPRAGESVRVGTRVTLRCEPSGPPVTVLYQK
jgi:cell division protein FtsI/penicillin-binding protein 2